MQIEIISLVYVFECEIQVVSASSVALEFDFEFEGSCACGDFSLIFLVVDADGGALVDELHVLNFFAVFVEEVDDVGCGVWCCRV